MRHLLERFPEARVLVVGDFFLDKYLILDARLTEKSLETGLDAYQVVAKRLYPGAAGTVTSNLRALDAGTVYAVGMVGCDGEGYELRAGLRATGVVTDLLVECAERFTPTYTKPMLRVDGNERELNRLDIKNRVPLPSAVEKAILEALQKLVPQVDAVVVADQVQERNCGVVTDTVRSELACLASRHRHVVFIADSRQRIGEFRDLWVKPNLAEAAAAAGEPVPAGLEGVVPLARTLQARNRRPVYITLGEQGILCVAEEKVYLAPTLRHTGPIDICGAGDSVMAGIVLALCAGARPEEAAVVGNLVASLTVQQIGVTGTTTRNALLGRFGEAGHAFQPRLL
ncbi:MAG: PfkB family carbohydrate kinase [Armatimonadota bacterium]|nr:PfkB family carbohydrate kinase [Armatimonadota bacterium]